MTRPARPVYLAVPSDATDCGAQLFSDFVDDVARHPLAVDDILLGVVEYATFATELAAVGSTLAQCARVTLSGFTGTRYTHVLDGLAQLLEYDAYRLNSGGVRTGMPLITMMLCVPPGDDDPWAEAHQRLSATGAALTAISLGEDTAAFAQKVICGPGTTLHVKDSRHASRAAADAVAAQVWGIGA